MPNPYQPSAVETGPQGHVVEVPGVSRRVEVLLPGFVGWKLYVDGQLAPKQGLFGKRLLRADNGNQLVARYLESLNGPVLVVDKQKLPIGPRYPSALGVLAFLPFALCFGGALGGGIGAAAWLVNRRVATSEQPLGLKVALMIGSTLVATALTMAAALAFRSAMSS